MIKSGLSWLLFLITHLYPFHWSNFFTWNRNPYHNYKIIEVGFIVKV